MKAWEIWWFIKSLRPNVFFFAVTALCALLGWVWVTVWIGLHLLTIIGNLLFNDKIKQHLKAELAKEQTAREGRREIADLNRKFDPDSK